MWSEERSEHRKREREETWSSRKDGAYRLYLCERTTNGKYARWEFLFASQPQCASLFVLLFSGSIFYIFCDFSFRVGWYILMFRWAYQRTNTQHTHIHPTYRHQRNNRRSFSRTRNGNARTHKRKRYGWIRKGKVTWICFSTEKQQQRQRQAQKRTTKIKKRTYNKLEKKIWRRK